jgi:hypothetical protein
MPPAKVLIRIIIIIIIIIMMMINMLIVPWQRRIKSSCYPAWPQPPLTTHPRVVFSSLLCRSNRIDLHI